MQTFDPMTAVYDGDGRNSRIAAPWELYHETSKLAAADKVLAEQARGDRLLRGELLRQERRVHEASAKAPTASSFFHSRRRVLLPLPPMLNTKLGVSKGASFAEVAQARRSATGFGGGSVPLEAVAFLVHCAAGVTHAHPVTGAPLRAAPSAGGLYELELYLAAQRVDGLACGLYHYHANSHSLAQLGGEEVLPAMHRASVAPGLVDTSAVYFVMTSVIGRLEWKYGQRSYRFALLNAGHTAQQLCLAATERGLTACPHGGFLDEELARCLGIDAVTEFVTHTVAVGHPRLPTKTAVAPRVASTAPRLRRLDRLDLPPHHRDWPALEALAVAACQRVAEEPIAAREALVHLGALLPGDRSVEEFLRYLEDPRVALEVDQHAFFAFPAEWGVAQRRVWRRRVASASKRVGAWLGADPLPRAFLDFRSASSVPKTENRDRWLHRRILLPIEFLQADRFDRDVLVHELAHAAYLPHNTFVAEGIAGTIGLGAEGIEGVVAELRANGSRPDLLAWVFCGNAPTLAPHLASAVSASFVATLTRRFGRERLLRWTDCFLYPATLSERSAMAGCFEDVFGETADAAIAAWWSQCP